MITPELLDKKLDLEFSQLYIGLLAEIDTYHKPTFTAKVHPLIKLKTKEEYQRLPVVKLPVNCFYAGGYLIAPDYKRGDIVDIKGNLVSTHSNLKGQVEIMIQGTCYNLAFGSVIGGHPQRPITISPTIQKTGLVIAHENGQSLIHIESDAIHLETTTAKIDITSTDLSVDAIDVTLKASGKITLDGDTEVKGTLDATGDISSEGEVAANSKATPTYLSKSKTATAIPGPPAPLTPG